jgi:hypothetical protein
MAPVSAIVGCVLRMGEPDGVNVSSLRREVVMSRVDDGL